jgi:uncharacterized membrane protein HdeD (DUF308 family)
MASTPAENTASAPPPPPPQPARRRNGAGTAALVVGIVSLVLAVLVIFAVLAIPLGIIAAILGGIGMSRARKGEADNRGHALTGLITGLLSIVVAVVIGISFVALIADHQSDLRKFGTCMTDAGNDTDRAGCFRRLGNQLERND